MYHAWLGPIAVRILVASNTVASVWSANTTVSTTVPAASSGATSGQVPTMRAGAPGCAGAAGRRRAAPPPRSDPVGWMPSVNAAAMIASAAGVSRPEMMARSIST